MKRNRGTGLSGMNKRRREMAQEVHRMDTDDINAMADFEGTGQIDREAIGVKVTDIMLRRDPGAFKGRDGDLSFTKFMSYIAPTLNWEMIRPNDDTQLSIGGNQVCWDATHWYSAGGAYAAKDVPCSFITRMTRFRDMYYKALIDATNINSRYTGNPSGGGLNFQPDLNILKHEINNDFTNTGNNTIVLEIWEMLCIKSCDHGPVYWMNQDLSRTPAGACNMGINSLPANTVNPQVDIAITPSTPGYRPMPSREAATFEHWKKNRVVRYVLKAGQSVTLNRKLPSTTLSHNQLYGDDDAVGDRSTYEANISMMYLCFAQGEMVYDNTVGEQGLTCSSAFVSQRTKWEYTIRCMPRARTKYSITTSDDLTLTVGPILYPQTALASQRFVTQGAAPVANAVTNFDA